MTEPLAPCGHDLKANYICGQGRGIQFGYCPVCDVFYWPKGLSETERKDMEAFIRWSGMMEAKENG